MYDQLNRKIMKNSIDGLSPYISKQKIKVLVVCLTYNQNKYIEDALNGFVMQKTNFPFVCLVMDDASTDGEQEVIKAWMERECDMNRAEAVDITTSVVVIVPHKNNASCTFAFYLLKQNLYGTGKKTIYINPWREMCEYEALCEGDDYWTDPLKLQKQVNFMDSNKECTMCFHSAIEHYEHKDIPDKLFSKISDKDYTGKFLFKNWIVPTASVLIRRSVLQSELYQRVLQCKDFIYGDTPLFVTCAELGKVRGMSDVMSVYRRNEGGVTFLRHDVINYKYVNHLLAFESIFGEEYNSDYMVSYVYVTAVIRLFMRAKYRDALILFKQIPRKRYLFAILISLPFKFIRSRY